MIYHPHIDILLSKRKEKKTEETSSTLKKKNHFFFTIVQNQCKSFWHKTTKRSQCCRFDGNKKMLYLYYETIIRTKLAFDRKKAY
jgi:hypothetical protein